MLLKKVYEFLYSKSGLFIVAALYFILPLPITASTSAILYVLGENIGRLISPLVIVLVLSRFFKWNRNQKILHIFLIGFGFLYILRNNLGIISVISIAALLILIIQIVIELFKKKEVKKEFAPKSYKDQ